MGKTIGACSNVKAEIRSESTFAMADPSAPLFRRKINKSHLDGNFQNVLDQSMAVPNGIAGKTSSPAEEILERSLARALGGQHIPGRGFWDLHCPQMKTAWDLKVHSGRRREDRITLSRIHTPDVLLDDEVWRAVDDAEMGRRLMSVLEARQKANAEKFDYQLRHSRLAILWSTKPGEMIFWEEPYNPREAAAADYIWLQSAKGLFAYEKELAAAHNNDIKRLSGKEVFSWYPKGGHFKYNSQIPANFTRLKVLKESLPDEVYTDRMVVALGPEIERRKNTPTSENTDDPIMDSKLRQVVAEEMDAIFATLREQAGSHPSRRAIRKAMSDALGQAESSSA